MMKDAATLRSSAYRLAAQNGQGSSSAVELATQTAFEAVSYETAGGVVTLNLGAWVDQTINYTYDPLYRLTAADYDNGSYYHYSYDANGNRVTETTVVGTVESVYDAANRLTSVGGVNYTWDDNGNLLADGQRSYTYDAADRLTSVTQGMNASTYTYNGLGERVSETVNGATTTFVLDMNAGLTQVLADGTNTYLYGNDRIGQFSTLESAYFLGDALGSVRQLADSGGSLTLARAYEPYGEVTNSLGSGSSAYGFTGELASSSTNLLYLRARFYETTTGRFLTRDVWQGNENRPLSYNLWLYAFGNPQIYKDPTGFSPTQYDCIDTPTTNAINSDYYDSCYAIEWVKKHSDQIRMTASFYGIPPELVGGVLASEIDFDIDEIDISYDAFTLVFYLKYFSCSGGLEKIILRKSLETFLLIDNGFGLAQSHYSSWEKLRDYFINNKYEFSTSLMKDSKPIDNRFDWTLVTLSDQGSIDMVGFYTRFLADYRKGSGGEPYTTNHKSDLTTVDMAHIFAAYRSGIGNLTCFSEGCGYNSIKDFQMRTTLGHEGRQAEPYFVYFRQYFWFIEDPKV